MDGVILLAFILGFPANEIVLPIMLMTYSEPGNSGGGAGAGQPAHAAGGQRLDVENRYVRGAVCPVSLALLIGRR